MNRIEWIDVAKGWGIILLIYGHLSTDVFSKWVYSFHIPMFFFLSGYLFNDKKKLKDFLLSKSKGLLLPYIFLGIPLIGINILYGYDLLFLLKCFFIQQRMFPLWFITALLLQFFIAYGLNRLISSLYIRLGIICILAFWGILFWHSDGKSLPWNFDVTLVALPFFYIGFLMRKYSALQPILNEKKYVKHLLIFLSLSVLGCWTLSLFPYPWVDLFDSHFSFEPLAYCTAFAGIFAIIVFSNMYHSRIISYIGRNSLIFFAWQQDIAIILSFKCLSVIPINNQVSDCVVNILVLIMSLLILTFISYAITHTPLRFLIGKE